MILGHYCFGSEADDDGAVAVLVVLVLLSIVVGMGVLFSIAVGMLCIREKFG